MKFQAHQVRHPLELVLLSLSAALTLLLFLVALALTAFKAPTYQWIEDQWVASHLADHPEGQALSRAEALKSLPPDDQETLASLRELELWHVLLAPIAFVIVLMGGIGRLYGSARSNGVKLGTAQFPEVYHLWQSMAAEVGLVKTPELFLLNGNGALNAFVSCVPGFRPFGVIYSDILERTLALRDERSLRFILGHELGHIRLGHVHWFHRLFTVAAHLPPLNYLLGLPLSRACEYSSDQVGAQLSGDRDGQALMMLAAGKHLYTEVNPAAHHSAQISERSLWDVAHNAGSSHPNLNWRIAALRCRCHGPLMWASAWAENAEPPSPPAEPAPRP
ncbi:M48 family metallopeptidase [Ideonella paludis]|uniref:M48 family metallopeptidase n=1 Tax=Ideonella paludis TaxID=1233411 RepID=A0ABS5DV52_9BURK|nr:M48 family metallopeptidase [Ideonella paludis]MBQ0935033.1 M48 family metallopeptidase [Ideonella paludis]